MKTACNSWSYHRTIAAGRMDQLSWVDECAALGLDGIELLGVHFPRTDRDYLLMLRKRCADLFLSIAMASADGHLSGSDDAERAEQVAYLKNWIEFGATLGAPAVRLFCPRSQELEAGGPALYARVIAALNEVADYAAGYGITMAMENHGGMTADLLLQILRDVDSPFLKLTLDTGNFPPGRHVGPDTYRSLERCAPHAAIVHAKFFDVAPDGRDREFDWERIRRLLDEAGFRGFLSLEYEGEDPDELGVIRRIVPYLKTLR